MNRDRVWWFDLALAAALTVVTQLETWLGSHPDRPQLSALLLATTAPLAWRRSRPLAVTLAVVGTFAVGQVLHGSLTEMASGTLPLLAAVYAGAAHQALRGALVAGGASLAAVLVAVTASPEPPDPDDFVYAVLLVTVAWSVGRVLSLRHERVRVLERDQEHVAAEAVRRERTRIARELHDVVAHGVSVMVLQAGGAAQALDRRPEAARDALTSIQSTGRSALVELRRMLELLRSTEGEADDLRPQPGLGELSELVAGAVAAGLPCELDLRVDGVEVPAAIALSAYRVVQEALTNCLKHAQAGRVTVRVGVERHGVLVEVVDDGQGATGGSGGGLGLLGMRERTAVFGGTLEIESTEGFTVRAWFPLERAP